MISVSYFYIVRFNLSGFLYFGCCNTVISQLRTKSYPQTNRLTMSLSVLPLLFFVVCSTQAFYFSSTQQPGFYGTATYYTKDTGVNGSAMLIVRYTLNNNYCYNASSDTCQNSSCGNMPNKINEMSGEWCQMEEIRYGPVPDKDVHLVMLDGGNWTYGSNLTSGANEMNRVMSNITTEALIDLRNRSDTGKENSSPQTTILPVMIVPSNCEMNFTLLMFDPDGDEIKCRFGNPSECQPCNSSSSLTILPSSCTLSFSPTNSSDVNLYAVQLMVEDFPIENITLTQTDGTETKITTNDAISKVPVQFILRVDTAVASCAEGVFLPKFLPPTPANNATFSIDVSQTLEFNITAEATNSTISELLFSGPSNVTESKTGPGEFTLRWMPSEREYGGSYPFCFVIQADSNGAKYYSELRCVIVSVGNKSGITTIGTTITTTAATLPSEATTTTAAAHTSKATTTTETTHTSKATTTTGATHTSKATTTTGATHTSKATTTTGATHTTILVMGPLLSTFILYK